ncbi:2Fe-2S iron-sulfur cluster binding domain-containing protein [Deinococcus sp. HMF7620]|uniref:2Fe-2S iron-sulfur cluster binding domain-containing protein n=1 Tax=Deinococcus arboris TaxID=2682977 RepID=A0A7C9IE15_9DEIO|nr:FAD binding domain-containing protein [Deinococcus arboris]MVN88726.1 2Fe-2S iron-sulfur cluster binding domain-containing protein [Deinococcus arboris]
MTIRLTINGAATQLPAGPHTTLLSALRSRGLTGCKEGCAEGECGACAVLVSRAEQDGTRWESVNACLVLLPALDGGEVVTAEGLGTPGNLHPAQYELAVHGGSQCGYCTPGFVCSMAAEYYRPDRTPGDHGAANGFDLHALSGNLCRCTGYRPIADAAYALGPPAQDDPLGQRRLQPAPAPQATALQAPEGAFFRPANLPGALALLAAHPGATILAGGTDLGVEVNLRHARPPVTVAVDALPELRVFEVGSDSLLLGAGLTLSDLERRLGDRVPLLAQWFPQFASRLIRNSATLGGNLGTASPIGDSPPALLALEASVQLVGPEGEREMPLADFFTGYRQTRRQPGELITAVRIPLPLSPLVAFHKVAKRRFDDISSVAVGYALKVEAGRVTRARIGLGGVAATPLRAYETEAALEGQPWTEETVRRAARILGSAGTPLSDHRASAAYRAAMLEQSLLKFFFESQEAAHDR